jgi:hypothetical protein
MTPECIGPILIRRTFGHWRPDKRRIARAGAADRRAVGTGSWRGLLVRDLETCYLALESAGESVGANTVSHLQGHSIACRIAVGAQSGRKALTLQTIPPRLDRGRRGYWSDLGSLGAPGRGARKPVGARPTGVEWGLIRGSLIRIPSSTESSG